MARKLIRKVLRLLAETDLEIIGEDEDGRVLGFFRRSARSCVFNRAEKSVSVVCAPHQLHARPYLRSYDGEPRVKVMRECLLCKHEFEAEPEHRICYPCKGTENWTYSPEVRISG